MGLQNRFKTGLDIARYTADIMRRDMAAYDADSSDYTQSLGCWHGFIGQQKMISIKKHQGTTAKRYLYLSGWMVAALRSDFGPLPDQSMHEKTSVPELIAELYTFLKQADARELNHLFRDLDDGQGRRRRSEREQAADRGHRQLRDPRRADHRRHRRRLRQRGGHLPAGQADDRGRRLLPSRSRTRCPTPSSAATRTARSPSPTRTSWPRSTPFATPSSSSACRRRGHRRPHRLPRGRPDPEDPGLDRRPATWPRQYTRLPRDRGGPDRPLRSTTCPTARS